MENNITSTLVFFVNGKKVFMYTQIQITNKLPNGYFSYFKFWETNKLFL